MRLSAVTKHSGAEVTTLAGASNTFMDPSSPFDVAHLRLTNRESQMKRNTQRSIEEDVERGDSKLAQYHQSQIKTGTGQIEVSGSQLRGAKYDRNKKKQQLQFSIDVDPAKRKTNIAGVDGAWNNVN